MIKLDLTPPDRQLSQFGWIALFGFPLVGLALWKSFGLNPNLVWILGGIGALTLVLSRIRPRLILPIYMAMTLIAIPIGFVVSWVLMGLVYYGLFTPFGIAFRLMGRDKLHRLPDDGVPTYWHDHGPQRSPASYFQMH
ncbi:MAG: hypothetical protein IPM29_32070 [Planctomycetes bacterium]|nr:hypothetical protein [Planctomycetota bacterium]